MSNSDVKNPPKVIVVGDSTLCAFQDEYFLPRFGYGTKLGSFFRSGIAVVNLALSGRSSKSFLVEPEYQSMKRLLRKGDFLVIAFGHNDEKPDAERHTVPNRNIDDASSFSYHLWVYYIRQAQAVGAIPLLCTPIVRRSPEGDYFGTFVHQTLPDGAFPGGDYPQEIRDLGLAHGITVLDMTESTKQWYEKIGSAGTLSLHARLTEDPSTVDNSHLNEKGATVVAYLFAKELSRTTNPLKECLEQPIPFPMLDGFPFENALSGWESPSSD